MSIMERIFYRKRPDAEPPKDVTIAIDPAQLRVTTDSMRKNNPEQLGIAAADPDFNRVMIERLEQSYMRAARSLGEDAARNDPNMRNLLEELSWRRTLRDFMNK